jgi:hypothetical protein
LTDPDNTAARALLVQGGIEKGDCSRSIEDAVKWRVRDQTLAEAHGQSADMAPEAVMVLVIDINVLNIAQRPRPCRGGSTVAGSGR